MKLSQQARLVLAFTTCHAVLAQLIDVPEGLTYSGNYTIRTNDTIFSIVITTDRGICDIARANRMADAELLRVGATLLIPSKTATPDNDSCLIDIAKATATTTRTCIDGGPHVYTVVTNDTLARIAAKLNVTVASLLSSTGPGAPPSPDAPLLPAGRGLKIPQCSPSQCLVQPYRFTYGTYKDLAAQFNTTVGQIFAFNPTYSSSDTTDLTKTPVITMPMNCQPLSASSTVVS